MRDWLRLVTWSLRDGSHEGGVGVMLIDGTISWGPLGQPLTVEYVIAAPDPEASPWDRQFVVGWMPGCVCGWRGPAWTRFDAPEHTDITNRRVFAIGDEVAGPVEDGPMYLSWREHVWQQSVLDDLARSSEDVDRASRRLTAAVATARQANASWTAIGRVTGITRQAAHQRWGHR